MNEKETNTYANIVSGTENHNLSSLGYEKNDGMSAIANMGEHKYDDLTLDSEPFVPLNGKPGNVEVLSQDMLFQMPGRYNQSEVINTPEQARNPNAIKRVSNAVLRLLHINRPS